MKNIKPILSLYTKLQHCLLSKNILEPFKVIADEANTTEQTVIKKLYEIDKGKITDTSKKIIEAIKKLCPKAGLVKHIKNLS